MCGKGCCLQERDRSGKGGEKHATLLNHGSASRGKRERGGGSKGGRSISASKNLFTELRG